MGGAEAEDQDAEMEGVVEAHPAVPLPRCPLASDYGINTNFPTDSRDSMRR